MSLTSAKWCSMLQVYQRAPPDAKSVHIFIWTSIICCMFMIQGNIISIKTFRIVFFHDEIPCVEDGMNDCFAALTW
jgi:hypothetical protein